MLIIAITREDKHWFTIITALSTQTIPMLEFAIVGLGIMGFLIDNHAVGLIHVHLSFMHSGIHFFLI